MTDAELHEELGRPKDERGALEARLEKARHRQRHTEDLGRDAALVLYLYAAGLVADLDKPPPEERRDLYRPMRLEVVIGRERTPEISADLIGGPGLLPTTDDASEAVKGRVRFDRDGLHAWLDSRLVGTGDDVYSVPDAVMSAYDALVAAQTGRGTGVVSKRIRVLMTREEIEPKRLADATVVVIDVFLATTTLLTILENGARAVYPVASLEEADRVAERLDKGRLLRGGEQGAKKVQGYDLGPYPEEYAPEVVAGKDVIFVTTNGTRAVGAASAARELLLGCLRNAPAVARHLEESGTESIYVVCAGSAGRFTLEDFLGASAVVSRLNKDGYLAHWRLNDAAWTALDFAKRHEGEEAEVLKESRAGRWFSEHDKVEELRFVADVGASDLVPKVVDGRLEKAVSGQPSAVGKKNRKADR